MTTMTTRVRNGLAAASLLAALGFGGTQALARPAVAQAPPTCNPAKCDKDCKAQFGPFAAGYCDPFGGCSCAV
jgi:hypothetical protein